MIPKGSKIKINFSKLNFHDILIKSFFSLLLLDL